MAKRHCVPGGEATIVAILGLVLLATLAAGADLVSINSGGTAAGNDDSEFGSGAGDSMSRRVTFQSLATDLTSHTDTNGEADVFSRDLDTGITSLLSGNLADTAAGDCEGHSPHSSPDGLFVVFTSCSSDLVATDTNKTDDVFLRDVVGGTTTLVSMTPGGDSGNDSSSNARVSGDGRFVVFESWATNLTTAAYTGDAFLNVYVRDMKTSETMLVSVDATGTMRGNGPSWEGRVSDDGRYVLFQSEASDLEAIDLDTTRDIFRRDLDSSTTELVSVNSAGTASGNGFNDLEALTPNGRFAVFQSAATDLVVTTDSNGLKDIFVRDLNSDTTSLVTANAAGTDTATGTGSNVVITPDGRWVAFNHSASDLVATDTNGAVDVFLRDVRFDRTTLVSRDLTGTDSGDMSSSDPSISEHGRWIAFESNATDLVPTDGNGMLDLFVFDRLSGEVELVSKRSAGDDSANGLSFDGLVSGDGRFLSFESTASDLVVLSTGGTTNVYQASNPLRGSTVWADAFESGDLSGWSVVVDGS